jgi:hypothetical protein
VPSVWVPSTGSGRQRWLSHRDEITAHLWMGDNAKVSELSLGASY